MRHPNTRHPAPSHLIESYRQAARETERALLDLRIDVLASIDAALIRSRSVEKGSAETVATGHDALGDRLRQSVMFADVRQS